MLGGPEEWINTCAHFLQFDAGRDYNNVPHRGNRVWCLQNPGALNLAG